jgi:hypothetical protein
MRKGFLAIVTVFAALLFSSCEKKEYRCKCDINYGGTTSVRRYELGKITNGTAEKNCNSIQEDIQNNGRMGAARCDVELDQ